jgi:prolyl 4-hydroxylase
MEAVARSFTSRWVSLSPRVLLVDRFLTPDECARLRALAAPRLEPCLVEAHAPSPLRTSSGCFLPRGDLESSWSPSPSSQASRALVASVEQRIAHVAGLPVNHGEPCQVLRYNPGEAYAKHVDYLSPRDRGELANGGQRVATALVYLSNLPPHTGGATHFPKALIAPSLSGGSGRPNSGGLRVAPVEGTLCLWWNVLPDGRADPRSLHASERVAASGDEKWALSKWLRAKPFGLDEEAVAQAGF